MISQTWIIEKAIRALFADRVTFVHKTKIFSPETYEIALASGGTPPDPLLHIPTTLVHPLFAKLWICPYKYSTQPSYNKSPCDWLQNLVSFASQLN